MQNSNPDVSSPGAADGISCVCSISTLKGEKDGANVPWPLCGSWEEVLNFINQALFPDIPDRQMVYKTITRRICLRTK